jgi:XTP/dITP diphosphohydrolase
MQILLATQNEHKVREVEKILSNEKIILPDSSLEIKEGLDYSENAKKKAKIYADYFLQVALADDSGLEIEILGDLPGSRSSRFFEGRNYENKMKKILDLMKGEKNRRAKYVCYIAIYSPFEGRFFTSYGYVNGIISDSIKGNNGFGYDPIFIPDGYDKTFGELPENIKNKISHRSNALESLKYSFFIDRKLYDEMISIAKEFKKHSYAKYSNFHVGAAVLSNGKIYGGCNIENSAYGSTMCAERVAIFKAISEGNKKIDAVSIIGDSEEPVPPCGSCRQVMSEFASPNMPVIMLSKNDKVKVNIFKDLLPYAFNLEG